MINYMIKKKKIFVNHLPLVKMKFNSSTSANSPLTCVGDIASFRTDSASSIQELGVKLNSSTRS